MRIRSTITLALIAFAGAGLSACGHNMEHYLNKYLRAIAKYRIIIIIIFDFCFGLLCCF